MKQRIGKLMKEYIFQSIFFRFLYILYLYSAGESTSSFPLHSSIAFATGRNKVCISTLYSPKSPAIQENRIRFFPPFLSQNVIRNSLKCTSEVHEI